MKKSKAEFLRQIELGAALSVTVAVAEGFAFLIAVRAMPESSAQNLLFVAALASSSLALWSALKHHETIQKYVIFESARAKEAGQILGIGEEKP